MSERLIRQALVTGSTGFVGNRLARVLLAQGVRVRLLVRNPAAAQPLIEAGAEAVCGDLRLPTLPSELLAGVDTVFHCAALLGPPSLPSSEFRAVNVDGSRRLAIAAVRGGIERFVHVSTVAVTGGSATGLPLDEDCPVDPRGHYAVTKLESEAAVRAELDGHLPFAVSRPAWVYGPDSISMRKLAGLVSRRRMPLLGGGVNRTQPIWVEDLVAGLLRCGRTLATGVFHMAGPTPMTTREMLASLAGQLGVPPPSWNVPMWVARFAAAACERTLPRSMRRLPIDSSKMEFFRAEHIYTNQRARDLLNWIPATDWPAGIRETCRTWRQEGFLP